MGYDPFNPDTFPILIIEGLITFAIWSMVLLLYKKIVKRKKENEDYLLPNLLLRTFIAYGFGITFLFTGFFSAWYLGFFKEYYRFTLPTGYVCVLIGNYFYYCRIIF